MYGIGMEVAGWVKWTQGPGESGLCRCGAMSRVGDMLEVVIGNGLER